MQAYGCLLLEAEATAEDIASITFDSCLNNAITDGREKGTKSLRGLWECLERKGDDDDRTYVISGL